MAIDSGALSVGQRLDRIEAKQDEVLRRLDAYATEADVAKHEVRLGTIERSYVTRATLWGLAAFVAVQFLVIIGLGLGLVYELLRH